MTRRGVLVYQERVILLVPRKKTANTQAFALKSCAPPRVKLLAESQTDGRTDGVCRSAPTRRDRTFPALQGSRGTPVAELLFSFAVGGD